jgi:hypothetical protein
MDWQFDCAGLGVAFCFSVTRWLVTDGKQCFSPRVTYQTRSQTLCWANNLQGVSTMKYHNEKPNLYARLDSVRISTVRRREAIAHIRHAEASADLIFSAVNVFRRAVAGMARAFRTRMLRTNGQSIF